MKTAIITGASAGIGRALAMAMGQTYHLGLTARREPLLKDLKEEILKKYPDTKVFVEPCDVGDMEKIQEVTKRLAKQLGRLDLFVANAGIGYPTAAWEKNWEGIREILQINIMGTIASLEAAKEIMLDQKSGHLVGISSVAAFRGLPATSAYCASKVALATYLESIRVDLKRFGIDVTSIHPGYIDTPMTQKNRHPMPFILPVDKGAQKILKAIEKKKARFIFPWPMKVAIWLLKFVPDLVYDKLIIWRYRWGVFR